MNERVIWDFLLQKTGNAYGTAAIMGNLMAESSLSPRCATGIKDPDYVEKADNDENNFAHDGHAFGLVQWCYYTRKGGLLAYAKQTGRSVGDLRMQLEYLVKEMSQDYKSVWNAVCTAKNIRSASDIVMLKYEKPSGTSEAAKKKRADYGKMFYVEYADEPEPEPQPSGKKMVRAKSQVNIRSGPGKNYELLGELKGPKKAELISTENGWHKIAVYVKAEFTEVIS